MKIRRIAALKTPAAFLEYVESLGIELPFEAELSHGAESPLARQFTLKDGRTVGNRFCILPMEGWDGTLSGEPGEHTARRWENFGKSGAKLIWGGEAVAVRHDGRANPNQLLLNRETAGSIARLRTSLIAAHQEHYGESDDLLVGLQLTHSGRFSRPNPDGRLAPRTVYAHPFLDDKFSADPESAMFRDEEIYALIDDFVEAAVLAREMGFEFVDIKHCHGYLGHEFLSAIDREGEFGGSFENRTRFLRKIAAGIQSRVPDMRLGVRLSAFDWLPFQPGADGIGVPAGEPGKPYAYAFGGDGTGTGAALDEPTAFLDLLRQLGIELVCITAGSPYYNPHIQRPALFPPSDGYRPPEDPLAGVARQIAFTAKLKRAHPDLVVVGSAYSYLQEYLPNVAQAAVGRGDVDVVGLGRMVLSYPDLPADVLAGRQLKRKSICRTFSDCTTAPRNKMVSGCFPLDPYYKAMPEAKALKAVKKESNIM